MKNSKKLFRITGVLFALAMVITLVSMKPTKASSMTFTVSYDANGGTGAPASQSGTRGYPLRLSANMPARSGYTFAGWSTTRNGAVEYLPGASYNKSVDVTLYASWTPNVYYVTYNANGGTGAPASQAKYHGINITLSTARPTRSGYTFVGWSSTKNGNLEYAAGGTYDKNTSITLYAKWQINTYSVTYNANGGSGAPVKQTKTYGQTLKLSSAKPTRSGYTFQGWATTASGSVAYAAGANYTANAAVTLYAVWKVNTYTVSYNANGGSGAPANQTKTHGKALTLSTTKPTRTGYTFVGWSSTKDGNLEYAAGGSYTKNTNITLFAKWQINTYTVTYNTNGGGEPPAKQTKTYGQTLTLASTRPSRAGYTFMGWATSSNGSVAYAAGAAYTANASVTLYAVWAKNYTVSYNANGGSGAPGNQTKVHGVSLTLSSTKPTRGGYTFQGWSITKDGAVKYAAGAAYTDNAAVTLYAVWKLNTYTVKYDANGGSGAPGNQTKTHGTNLTLSTAKPSRSGYIFKGWSTTKDGAVAYAAGATYTANAAITLYAKWAKAYTVSYVAKDASNVPAAQTKEHGVTLTLSAKKPTKTGYTFVGWSSTDGGELEYAAGGSYTKDTNITLYAKWQINTYAVTYNANGGSGAPAKQTKTYGINLTLSATKPTRSGYTFQGWATTASGTVAYAAGATYTANAAVTLYAVWKLNTYTVTFNANGGSNPPAKQTKTHGTNLTLSTAKPTRTGYTFVGWSSTKDGDLEYAAGGTYDKNANITLYAKWQINTYSVTYNANGGSGAPAKQTKTYGINLTLSATKPTRSGYTFQGWATTASGTVAYAAGATYSANQAITLYAVWKLNTYTVTFNANGGSNPPEKQTKTHGTNLTLSSTKPTRTGYTFVGWSSTKDGNLEYAAGGTYDKNANITLYAKWQIITYYVNYNANGGSNAPAKQSKNYGTKITLTKAEPTREGYTFLGWATSASGTVVYAAGATYSENKTITLYAVWAKVVLQKVVFYSDDPKSGRPYEKVYEANITSGTTEYTFPNPEKLVLDDATLQHYYDHYEWATVGKKVTNDTLISPGEKVKVADIPFVDGKCEFYAFTPYYFVNYHVYLSDNPFSTDRTEHVLDQEYLAKEVWPDIDKEQEDEIKSIFPDVYVGLNTIFDKNGNIQVKGNNNTVVDISWLKDSNRPSPYLGYSIAHVIGWTTNPNNPTIIYKPGDIVDLASQGRNVDLYALWAPREIDYFPDEMPCYWMGFEYDGSPCMSFYLTADQVGTGTIADAVKGSSDPDTAWRTRASKSFASVVFEAAENRPTKIDIHWVSRIAKIVVDSLRASLKSSEDMIDENGVKRIIKLVENKDFKTAVDDLRTVKDIASVFLYMMYNPDTLQRMQNALLNLGITRENGVVAGEHAKAIRVDIRFAGEEVYITELSDIAFFGRCDVDDEGIWVKRSEDPEYFEKLLSLTVPEYKEYFFSTIYKPEWAEYGNSNNSLKRYIWIGGEKGADGKYKELYAKMYIPARYAGTSSLKSVLSKQGNPDELWKRASDNSVVARIYEAFEHKKMPSSWWLRAIDGAVGAIDSGVSMFLDKHPLINGAIILVEGVIDIGADCVYNQINYGKAEKRIDSLRELNICRSAGIVYNPKNICIEIRKSGDSVSIEEYGYNPDLSKSPIEGIEGFWIEEGEDYDPAFRICINMLLGSINPEEADIN